MRLLADTHLLIWAATSPEQLSQAAVERLSDAANLLLFSPLSIAEVAIKRARNRADFKVDPSGLRALLLANDWAELPLTGVQASRLADLPPIHKDPFDRLMIAQALAEGIPFLTADATLAGYPGSIMLV